MKPPVVIAATVAMAAAYFVLAWGSLSIFAVLNDSASPVWLPSGLAIAVVLYGGRRWLPAIALGSLAANLVTSGHAAASIAIAIGNTGEAWLAATIASLAEDRRILARPAHWFLFVGAAAAGAALSAGIGISALAVFGLTSWSMAPTLTLTWWLGNVAGALLVVPLFAAWHDRHPGYADTWEAVISTGILLIVAVIVFGGTVAAPQAPMAFLSLPVLVWIAHRSGAAVAAIGVLTLTLLAAPLTLLGRGPFAGVGVNEGLLLLQLYMGITATAAMALASAGRESDYGAARLERSVVQRTAELQAALDESRSEMKTRRTTEERLRNSEARLQDAQRIARIGSWEYDIASDSMTWSDEMRRILGYSDDFEPSLAAMQERVAPDDAERLQRAIDEARDSRMAAEIEHEIVTPDGEIRRVHAEVMATRAGDQMRLHGTLQDLSGISEDHALASLALRQRRELEDLKELNKMRTQLLNTAAHELKTPLTPLRLQLHLLTHGGEAEMDEKQRRAVRLLDRNVQRLCDLVDDVLDVARLDGGKMTLQAESLWLGEIIDEATDSFADTAQQVGVQLRTDIPAGLAIEADRMRITQVVYNVISNALKFTPSGGLVTVSAAVDDDGIRVEVQDSGAGMTEEQIGKLFQPFGQVHNNSDVQGTGLGLYICKGILEQHGGRIWARSPGPDKGTTFSFTVPAAKRPPEAASALPKVVRAHVPADNLEVVQEGPMAARLRELI